MSTERELAALNDKRIELETDIARIKTQIEQAKARAFETGEYADRGWFSRARYALRMKGIEHQQLLREIAAINKARRAFRGQTFERAFHMAARRLLDPSLFRSLEAAAFDDMVDVEAAMKAMDFADAHRPSPTDPPPWEPGP